MTFIKADENYKQINPYNFISLEDECSRVDENELKGNLTGFIECELETRTPIIIPSPSEINEETGKYDTFKYGNYPAVIPGSELRGMLRSDYEVFTNSCLSTIDQDISFVSRFMDPRLPGIVKKENGEWVLYKATRHLLETRKLSKNSPPPRFKIDEQRNSLIVNGVKCQTGDSIYFASRKNGIRSIVTKVSLDNNDNMTKGILFIGESFLRKKYDSIFTYEQKNNLPVKVNVSNLEKSLKDLKNTYEVYNDTAVNKNLNDYKKSWYNNYFREDISEFPVWYSEPNQDNEVYLSLAQIGKEKYHRTIDELVGTYMPCIEKKHICRACDLFGFTSNEESSSSKIRITDATTEDQNCLANFITLKELATPHHSNAIFYALLDGVFTENGQASLNYEFNYDYIIKKTGELPIAKNKIKIRGRKAYWHHSVENATASEKNKMNCTVRPIKEYTTFKFKIYFDKINQKTLDELISVIELKYQDKDLCHKIGRGKPLGFGSIKIKTNNIYIRNIEYKDNKISYNMVSYNDYFESSKDNISLSLFNLTTIPMKEALRIYDFNYLSTYYKDAKVQYPIGIDKRNNVGTHIWFVNNKGGNINNHSITMVLPRIIDGLGEDGKENTSSLLLNKTETKKVKGLSLPKLTKM